MATVTNSDQQIGGADAENVTSLTSPGVTPTGANPAVWVTAVGGINGATGNYWDEARYTNSSGALINQYVGANQLLSYFSFSEGYAKIRGAAGSAVGSPLPIYVHWPNGNYSAAMTVVWVSGADQTTPYGTEVSDAGFLPSGTSAIVRDLVFAGLEPGQLVLASISFFCFGTNDIGAVVANNGDTEILEDAEAAAHEAREVRIVTCWGEADGSGDLTLSLSVTPTVNDNFIRYSFNGNPVNDAAGGGSPATLELGGTADREITGAVVAAPGAATVAVGGSLDREAAGGLAATPGAAAIAVGGSRARESAGGLVAAPGAAAIQVGGLVERERTGAVAAAAGAVSLQPGGTREREAAGGVVTAAGVQTIVAGGTASAERGGGLIVVPGVAIVVAGGVAEQSVSGGHQVVPGVVGIALGGSAQRELIGGLSAQIGVASLSVGGRDEQERPGGASVYGGAVQLQLGGVAEQPRAGGLHMVDGTAPVAPTWPAGGTGRVGGRVLVDTTERIGGKRLTGLSRRIG